MHTRSYETREEAGKILADLVAEKKFSNPYILAIPRGGVQVAQGVADRLQQPINVLISKKLPIPGSPETAFGAITSDGTTVIDEETAIRLNLDKETIDNTARSVIQEIKHREEAYGTFNQDRIKFSDVIIVDDGIATGHSIMAAINSVKNYNPGSITVAVPVAYCFAVEKIRNMVDNFICPIVEEIYFFAVGNYYDNFGNLPEEKIEKILEDYRKKY